MPFEKGQSGNPAGRPLGARNKATLVVEKRLQSDIEDIDKVLSPYLAGETPHTFAKDFFSEELTARDRLLFAEKLMHYRFPKMQAITAETNITATRGSIAEQLKALAEEAE